MSLEKTLKEIRLLKEEKERLEALLNNIYSNYGFKEISFNNYSFEKNQIISKLFINKKNELSFTNGLSWVEAYDLNGNYYQVIINENFQVINPIVTTDQKIEKILYKTGSNKLTKNYDYTIKFGRYNNDTLIVKIKEFYFNHDSISICTRHRDRYGIIKFANELAYYYDISTDIREYIVITPEISNIISNQENLGKYLWQHTYEYLQRVEYEKERTEYNTQRKLRSLEKKEAK